MKNSEEFSNTAAGCMEKQMQGLPNHFYFPIAISSI